MELDWARLARKIAEAREESGMTQLELAAALGVGRSAVQKLERGHAYAKVQPIHRAVARAVGWTEGSIDAVLAGGEPIAAARAEQSAAEQSVLPEGMSERARRALSGGRAVDSDVVSIEPGDPGLGEFALVWKAGDRQLTPEEMQRSIDIWERTQVAIRDIVFGKRAKPPTP